MFFLRRPRVRVLFICTANVCRSPLAEALLRHYLAEQDLNKLVEVRSAGTRVAAPGRRPDPRMEKLMRQKGLSWPRIRARAFRAPMADKVDLILTMDRGHLQDLAALASTRPCAAETTLLGKYLVADGEEPADILDPYFGDAHCFETVFDQIDRAVVRLSQELHQTCATLARRS